MKKLNVKGFTVIEALLIFLVLGLVGGIGYYVFTNKNTTPETSNQETNNTENKKVGFSYTLPDEWTEMECNSSNSIARLASPDNDKALDCDDRTNSVLISDGSGSDACLTENQITEIQKMKPLSNYKCEVLKVDGVKVVKDSANYGGGITINYSFQGEIKSHINYYTSVDGTLPNAAVVEQLVNSVRF